MPGYRLVKMLGRGGYGSVWLAEAPGGFKVAIKVVPLIGRLADSERKSLPLLRTFRHPNLLTTFGAWETDWRLVIAMELADRTVADRLQEVQARGGTGLPPDELLLYMRGAAKGLDYLNHPRLDVTGGLSHGVQHRDVKPQNLLLLADHIKVGDFGLARVLEATVSQQSVGFTPAYAAPECFRGEAAAQSDQYSLAVTYCHLRGGRLPFTGNLGELFLAHLEQAPDLTMLPEGERSAVARALSKQPANRWPTCGAFVDAVAAVRQEGEPALGANPSRPRRRLIARVIVTGLFGVLLGAVVLLGVFAVSTPNGSVASTRSTSGTPSTEGDTTVGLRSTNPTSEGGTGEPLVPPVSREFPPGERSRFHKHAGAVYGVAWVPNSTKVVTCGDAGEVWVWDTATDESMRLVGHTGRVHAVAVSADGSQALTSGADTTVRQWDLKSGDLLHTMTPTKKNDQDQAFEVYGVAFLGRSEAVSAGNSNIIMHWDLKTGLESSRFNTEWGEVLSFSLSPTQTDCVLGGVKGRVGVHRIGTGGIDLYTGHTDDVSAADWFPHGKRFVTAGGGQGKSAGNKDYAIRVWTLGATTCDALVGHEDRVTGARVSPDGERILSVDLSGRVRLWDVDRSKEFPRFDAETKNPSGANAVAFSWNGLEAVTGHSDGTVRVWRLPK